jgi:hypothetical protein
MRGADDYRRARAGWYFDPDGGDHERYWNGEAWTEHRRSKPSSVNPLQADGLPHPVAYERLPSRRNKVEVRRGVPNYGTPDGMDSIRDLTIHMGQSPSPSEVVSAEQGTHSGGIQTAKRSAPELSLGVIEELKNKGLSQSEIAKLYGVSRQAISWHKHTYSGQLTPREILLKHFPWKVSSLQSQACPWP